MTLLDVFCFILKAVWYKVIGKDIDPVPESERFGYTDRNGVTHLDLEKVMRSPKWAKMKEELDKIEIGKATG